MKRVILIFSLLSVLSCASLMAEEIDGTFTVTCYSPSGAAFEERGYSVKPWTYADGTPVKAGERFRLIAVQATSSADFFNYKEAYEREKALILSGEARVELDVLGNIRLVGFPDRYEFPSTEPVPERVTLEGREQGTEEVTQVVGSGLAEGTIGTGTQSLVLETVDTFESQTVDSVTGSIWNVTPPSGTMPLGSGWWLFLVVEDTRSGVALTPNAEAPWHVASVGAVVMDTCTKTAATAEPLFCPASIMGPIGGGYPSTYVEAPRVAMRSASLPDSVTTENGKTYSDLESIEALFSPALGGFASEGDGFRLTLAETAEGKPQSLLEGEPVQDGFLYSVFTATSLVGPWENLDEVAKKKGVAKVDEKGYTRACLSDLDGKLLPSFGDKTRFYKVQPFTVNQGE